MPPRIAVSPGRRRKTAPGCLPGACAAVGKLLLGILLLSPRLLLGAAGCGAVYLARRCAWQVYRSPAGEEDWERRCLQQLRFFRRSGTLLLILGLCRMGLCLVTLQSGAGGSAQALETAALLCLLRAGTAVPALLDFRRRADPVGPTLKLFRFSSAFASASAAQWALMRLQDNRPAAALLALFSLAFSAAVMAAGLRLRRRRLPPEAILPDTAKNSSGRVLRYPAGDGYRSSAS